MSTAGRRRALLAAALLLAPLAVRGAERLDFDRIEVARSATADGDRLLRASRFVKAEDRFRAAIAAADNYPPAYLGLGSALVGQGRFAEAVDVLHRAEGRYVTWKGYLEDAKIAHRRYTLDQKQEANDLLARARVAAALVNTQTEASAVLLRVIQHLEIEVMRLEGARRSGEQIDPGDIAAIPAQVFYLEGISQLRLGDREAGVEALEVALLLDESHPLASYNLAVALFVAGRYHEAKEHLAVAIAGGVEPPASFVRDLDRALAGEPPAADAAPPS